MQVRVCVAIRESTTEAALEALSRAGAWADLVEVRGDYIRNLDLGRLLREKTRPVLFTLRSREEGGSYIGSERNRLETILEAAKAGADYVDVEYSAFWQAVLDSVPKEQVVLSRHDFDETPANLDAEVESMASTGAGILKIATRARRLADNVKIAHVLQLAQARKWNLCALAMGDEGLPSRVLGPAWGSWMTFASLPGSEGTADGQVPADELIDQYRIREIGPITELYGVLGNPLGHSLSPLIHNAAFKSRGLNAVYLPLQAAGMEDFQEFHTEFRVRGASVTLPYKEVACAISRSLSVEADSAGAVNTLVKQQDGWHGENTDVDGFLRPLKRRVHVGRMRAVVLGAGGAARSVVQGLLSQGASPCIVARDASKAKHLADRFRVEHAAWDQLPHLHWDLLVNATPVGMHPDVDRSPMKQDWLTGEWVYDLVYNPRATRLLIDAATRGCKTVSGIEMFLGQALKQQQLWCGSPVPEQAMRDALDGWFARSAPHEGDPKDCHESRK